MPMPQQDLSTNSLHVFSSLSEQTLLDFREKAAHSRRNDHSCAGNWQLFPPDSRRHLGQPFVKLRGKFSRARRIPRAGMASNPSCHFKQDRLNGSLEGRRW